MIRRDMPEVLAIEQQSFEFPWQEDDFIRCLRNRNVIGMVCEAADRTAGFVVYEILKNKLRVLNFAVHEDWRYKGIGSAMVNKLTSKLSYERRTQIVLEIRESNLDAQLFFKRMGFRAVGVLHDFYEDTAEDAYRFAYRLDWNAPVEDEPEKENPWQDDGEPIA